MKKLFKSLGELKVFLDTKFAKRKIKTYNIIENATAVTLTWKEETVEQGLNKTQLKEVKQIVSEAIEASEKRTNQVLDKIILAVQANAKAIEANSQAIEKINKNIISLNNKIISLNDKFVLLNNKIDDIALTIKK